MIHRQLYALGLLLGVLVLALAPVHGALTQHHWVVRTLGPDRVELALVGGSVEVGQRLPVHRHNPSWIHPIGHATVLEVEGDRAVAHFDGDTYRWPMGRHGQILSAREHEVVVDLGASDDLAVGDVLHAFEGTRLVLRVEVAGLSEHTATATVLKAHRPASELVGAPVTEFTVRTRASPLSSGVFATFEALLLAVALGLWGWSWVSPVPGGWWRRVAGRIRAGSVALADRPWVRWAFHAALAPLIPVFVVPFSFFSAMALAHAAANGLASLGVPLEVPPRFPPVDLLGLQVAGTVTYLAWFFLRGTSPLLALWRSASYTKIELAWFPLGPSVGLWLLHLLIFAAFGSTLTSFLAHNMTLVVQTLWPAVDGSLLSWADAGRTVAAIWGVPPTMPDTLALFEVGRYTLWSATICGCLLGYGHTVLSILWKRPLNNLDFTITGWLTNAVCYGPLLGVVLHHLLPQGGYTGADPIITEGPLYGAILAVELLLNVLYTASIWNLGIYFGVMSDKGLRTTGFYGVVRHPSYTLEALLFVVMFAPGLSGWGAWLAASTFFVKYWLRSEREDHFLQVATDGAYDAYRQAVPDKYVPGLV